MAKNHIHFNPPSEKVFRGSIHKHYREDFQLHLSKTGSFTKHVTCSGMNYYTA